MRYNYTPADLNFQSVPLIQAALDELKTDKLYRISLNEFEREIKRYLNNEVPVQEKYPVGENSFAWGHDHDFGTFKVAGRMGTRHIWMLSRFFDHFGVSPTSVKGKSILDIGCWAGGVSLVLNKLGGKVMAIDPDHKRIHPLYYLVDSFNLTDLECRVLSVYDLQQANLTAQFDLVFCLGVVYHLTDPIIALRRIYHVMRPGGMLCLESMSIDSDQRICEYAGPSQPGGNWFIPAPHTLYQWLEDTGFEEIKVGNGLAEFAVTNDTDPMGGNRCFALARKKAHHTLSWKPGLSSIIT